jgi:hypothetical protein
VFRSRVAKTLKNNSQKAEGARLNWDIERDVLSSCLNYKVPHLNFKGIVRPFEFGSVARLIQSGLK